MGGSIATTVVCAACGQANPVAGRFCGHCGATLALRCDGCGATQPTGSVQRSGTLAPGTWVLQLNAGSGGQPNPNAPNTWTSAVSDEFSLTISP